MKALTKTQKRLLAVLRQTNDGKPNYVTTQGKEGRNAEIWSYNTHRDAYTQGYRPTEATGSEAFYPKPKTLTVLLEAGLIYRVQHAEYDWHWSWYASTTD